MSDAVDRVIEARQRRKGVIPTDEEWADVKAKKNSDADKRKLTEVKKAMDSGELHRDTTDAYDKRGKLKKFSKAEALRLWTVLEDRKKSDRIRKLIESTPSNYTLVNTQTTLTRLRGEIEHSDLIAVDCETFSDKEGEQLNPWVGGMAGFSISSERRHFYVPINHDEGKQLTSAEIFREIKESLESTPNVMHNAPFDAKWFYIKYDINIIDVLYADTQVMAMALDENISHRLKDLCEKWLGITESWTFDKLFAKMHRFNEVPLDAALVYGGGDTDKTLRLFNWMIPHFDRREDLRRIAKLVFEMEMPIVKDFIWADINGIPFDLNDATRLDNELENEENELTTQIHALLGEEINLASPAQLKKKLFTDLKLPDLDGGSTATKVLEKITSRHEVIPKILQYREVSQLRKMFTKTLPGKVSKDGRIHQSHNTWGTKTGRFTCKNPKKLGRASVTT